MSNIHPTMAAALAPFAPKDSEVHQIAEQAEHELDAWECNDCGGAGRVTVYSKVTHQLGTDTLPFWETCPTCDGLKFCGPDAQKRAALPCTLPGVEVSEATHADFVDSMAGDLELVPIERDSMNRMLERAEMRMSDATFHALRNEVNGGAA